MLHWKNPPRNPKVKALLDQQIYPGLTYQLTLPQESDEPLYRIDSHNRLRLAEPHEDGYSLTHTIWTPEPSLFHSPLHDLIKNNLAFGVPFPTQPGNKPCLFLDRDGILIKDTGYPHRPEDLHLIPDCLDLIRQARTQGYKVIVITNQAGIAKKVFNEQQYEKFTKLMVESLSKEQIVLDDIYACYWHSQGHVYRRDSIFRKPHPGMILQACQDHSLDLTKSLMVGDKDSDQIALPALKSFVLEGDYPLKAAAEVRISKLHTLIQHL